MKESLPTKIVAETPSLIELDDLAYCVATTYGERGYKKCWEVSIGFEDVWDEPRWGQRDEQAYLRLKTSGLWTLAYLPTREEGQRGSVFSSQAWLRAAGQLYRVQANNSIKYTPQELTEEVTSRNVIRSPISVRRAQTALELMNLRLSSQV